jgi:hypothetical protein
VRDLIFREALLKYLLMGTEEAEIAHHLGKEAAD